LIIQNRKQIKDITRRLNLLKIQERQRQLNLEKAQALNHSPQSRGVISRTSSTGEPSKASSSKVNKQSDAAGPVKDGHSASISEAEKRPRRRRANPGSSMMGSGESFVMILGVFIDGLN
jgi:hypothetical protein